MSRTIRAGLIIAGAALGAGVLTTGTASAQQPDRHAAGSGNARAGAACWVHDPEYGAVIHVGVGPYACEGGVWVVLP